MLNSNEVLNGNFPASRRFSATHYGIDLACPNNTGVKARFSGVVKVTGTNPPGQDFGNYIRLYHPQLNISSWYAHLLSFNVKVGQNVTQGQLIGHSNNTGLSSGPHLHYAESTGETSNWLNPDTTQGGDDMISTESQNNLVFLIGVFRNAYPQEVGRYIGKTFDYALEDIRKNQDRLKLDQMVRTYPALQQENQSLKAQLAAGLPKEIPGTSIDKVLTK